jgi:hypothetical protein
MAPPQRAAGNSIAGGVNQQPMGVGLLARDYLHVEVGQARRRAKAGQILPITELNLWVSFGAGQLYHLFYHKIAVKKGFILCV